MPLSKYNSLPWFKKATELWQINHAITLNVAYNLLPAGNEQSQRSRLCAVAAYLRCRKAQYQGAQRKLSTNGGIVNYIKW